MWLVRSASNSYQGKESFWVVLFIWGFLLYSLALFIGLKATFFMTSIEGPYHIPMAVILSIAALIMTFIYPVIFSMAVWRCASNFKEKYLTYLGRLTLLGFIVLHYYAGRVFFVGFFVNFVAAGQAKLAGVN